MASGMLKEVYETRLGNKRAVDVATWLSGGREEEELRKGEAMEVIPVTVGSQCGRYMVGHRTPGVSPSWGCYSQYTEGYSPKLRPTC